MNVPDAPVKLINVFFFINYRSSPILQKAILCSLYDHTRLEYQTFKCEHVLFFTIHCVYSLICWCPIQKSFVMFFLQRVRFTPPSRK